jgi:hypothetical protein
VDSVRSGVQIDWDRYTSELFTAVEWAWNVDNKTYPVTPNPGALRVATATFAKYVPGYGGGASAPPGYVAVQGEDAQAGTPGVPVDLMQAWHRSPSVLAFLCSTEPTCRGFNSNGYLKNDTSRVVTSAGTTLYLKVA